MYSSQIIPTLRNNPRTSRTPSKTSTERKFRVLPAWSSVHSKSILSGKIVDTGERNYDLRRYVCSTDSGDASGYRCISLKEEHLWETLVWKATVLARSSPRIRFLSDGELWRRIRRGRDRALPDLCLLGELVTFSLRECTAYSRASVAARRSNRERVWREIQRVRRGCLVRWDGEPLTVAPSALRKLLIVAMVYMSRERKHAITSQIGLKLDVF